MAYGLVEVKRMIDLRNEVVDILAKMQFFQGQRAGRELWNDKPFEVQEKDLESFNTGIETIRKYILQLEEQPKVNQWIPVEDRLPEKDGQYLCCSVYLKQQYYEVLNFAKNLQEVDDYEFSGMKRPGFYHLDNEWGNIEDADVVSWMLLPAPYDMRKKVEE